MLCGYSYEKRENKMSEQNEQNELNEKKGFIGKIYNEVKRRPLYNIQEILGE